MPDAKPRRVRPSRRAEPPRGGRSPAEPALVADAVELAPALSPPVARHQVLVGHARTGATLMDVGRLLSTRLLIQAGSGGGKSWLLRRIIEQTHGMVQQVVFDPEDELGSLADGFDFVVCAPDSKEVPIHPDNGAEVARAIFMSRRSAILSLGEFDGLEEMQIFVGDFCRELLRMPKETWHHMLVAFDEAQLFAPEKEKAESRKPLVDLSRRGRKRGICPIFATQRLSELSKGVAGQLENKMIGLTTLDLDLARAADMLGMRATEARGVLSRLPTGTFVTFGPALGYDLVETKVGPVQTKHAHLGEFTGIAAEPTLSRDALAEQLRALIPPPPPAPGADVIALQPPTAGVGQQAGYGPKRRRGAALMQHCFEIAIQVINGATLLDLADRHEVTDHAVRQWLYRALLAVDIRRFGQGRLRIDALREQRHVLVPALVKAMGAKHATLTKVAA